MRSTSDEPDAAAPPRASLRGRSRDRTPAEEVQPSQPLVGRRRPWLIGLGVALFAIFALGGWALLRSSGQTTTVVGAAADLDRGQVITAQDLQTITLPSNVDGLVTVPAVEIDELVGQVATVDILDGTTITPAAVAPQLTPDAGTSIVGVAVTTTQMPTADLHAGDQIRVVTTPASQGDAPITDPDSIIATVVSTVTLERGDTIINVEVPESEAPALAARVATGRIAIVLDSQG